MKYYLKRNRHRIFKGFLAVVFVVGGFMGLRYFLNTRGTVVTTAEESTAQDVSDDNIIRLKSSVLNFGSVSWADTPTSQTPTSPFKSFETLTRPDNDAWIGNLSCPVANSDMLLACDDVNVADFGKWFNVVALGGLRGTDGKNDASTTERLAKYGVQFFGQSTTTKRSEDCEVVALPARYELVDGSYKQATLPIILCAVDGEKTITADIISEIKEFAQSLPVWVYALDSGNASALDRQQQYHTYIDAGAELVMGVTAPNLGTSEVYRDRLIMYSLGLALGPPDPQLTSRGSALLSVDVSVDRDEIYEWEKIAKTCTGYEDLCLEAGRSKSLTKPRYTYKYAISPIDISDTRNPKPAEVTLSADILGTLKWFDTNALLKVKQQ